MILSSLIFFQLNQFSLYYYCYISGYTLTYERKNNTLSRESKDLPAVALNTSITELLPETNYTITIWARTSMGAGPTRTTDIESGKPPGMWRESLMLRRFE